MMSKRLILVRHSLPEMNWSVPARDWKLSDDGKARAERLAESLVRYQPEKLFSSPGPKAVETAEVISERLHLPVAVVEDLHEHTRSQASFLTKTEFEAILREFFEQPDILIFGSETANEAFERFSRAVYSAFPVDEHGTAAVITHGTVMSLFVSRLTGQPGFRIWSTLGLPGYIVLDLHSQKMIASENIS